MSTCYKCGKELPAPQVECDDECGPTLPPLAPTPAVLEEVARGRAAIKAVLEHLQKMGCNRFKGENEINGRRYSIQIEEL